LLIIKLEVLLRLRLHRPIRATIAGCCCCNAHAGSHLRSPGVTSEYSCSSLGRSPAPNAGAQLEGLLPGHALFKHLSFSLFVLQCCVDLALGYEIGALFTDFICGLEKVLFGKLVTPVQKRLSNHRRHLRIIER